MSFYKNQLKFILLAFFMGISIVGCLFSKNEPIVETKDAKYSGMNLIPAMGKTFTQGSSDSLSGFDEQPPIQVTFKYEYWMDSLEVSQNKFFKITGKKPVPDTSLFGVGDDYPVYNVTWYDAMLYCNALSKVKNLDTVYAYLDYTENPHGSIISMTGLTINFDKEGYRLPTEAEWEFAVRAGSESSFFWGTLSDSLKASAYAWYLKNAQGSTHPVATLQPNKFGLYDMAGNVMEWSNDWKGHYTVSAITNSLGNKNSNSKNERVIKGGSFNYGILSLRSANRSATYPTISSSRVEYVGFRCVLGVIENGVYYAKNHTSRATNLVTINQTKAQIKDLLLTDKVKVCFTNVTQSMHNLCYIDFNAQEINVIEILDTFNVFHPTISPDGQFVAFCTKNVGLHSPSSIVIRRLDPKGSELSKLNIETGYIPRWWVSPASNDTFLVYTNSGINNQNSSTWESTSTYRLKISGGKPCGSPQVIVEKGGYHDGLSLNGRYLATGFSHLLVRDLFTHQTQQYFFSPENGKDSAGSTQLCNLSISPHKDQPLLAFLDFGYPRISTIINKSYSIHEYIFISDIEGTVLKTIKSPANDFVWDHTEWSNHEDYLISGVTNHAGAHTTIYLINQINNNIVKIVEGKELWQPNLWIGDDSKIYQNANEAKIDLDSVGRYMTPLNLTNQTMMMEKMRYFWPRHDDLEVVFMGNSRMLFGLNPSQINGYTTLNMSDGGMGLYGITQLTQSYILNHCPKIKLVGISLYVAAFVAKNADISWTLGMSKSLGYQYDKNHHFWKNNLPANFSEYISNAPYIDIPIIDTLGFLKAPSQNWGAFPPEILVGDFSLDSNIYHDNLAMFKEFCDSLSSRGIHILVINFPQSPSYRYTGSYGRHGPSWSTAKQVVRDVTNIINQNSYCHLYDANNFGHHDYTNEDAYDFDHLSEIGAVKLSNRINNVIQDILN